MRDESSHNHLMNGVDPVLPKSSEDDPPDVGFSLATSVPAAQPETADPPADLEQLITAELFGLLAPDWQRLDAAFALTVTDEAAQVIVSDDQQATQIRPSARAVELLREHRHRSAQSGDGPWWRFVVSLTNSGDVEVEYDYGAEPFPEGQLFPVQTYRADLQAYPRKRLPMWLAAYTGHDDRQIRTPRAAFTQAGRDRANGISAAPAADGLPPLPLLWARWAVISAVFIGANSQWGPRITTALGWFEGTTRSGSTLHRLPDGRAVLSGGQWNASALDAAYNDGAPMPKLYRGAPEWVADPVLNPRAANGLLSFCYWWDGTAWLRGDSPDPDELSAALPGVWTSESAIDVIEQTVRANSRAAVVDLVFAAEHGTVTRTGLEQAVGDATFDINSAYYQLMLAGLVKSEPAQTD